jgi:hypothetical protein
MQISEKCFKKINTKAIGVPVDRLFPCIQVRDLIYCALLSFCPIPTLSGVFYL